MSSSSVLLKAAKGRAQPHNASMPWQPRSPCGACEASDSKVSFISSSVGPLTCQAALVDQDKLPSLLQVAQQVTSQLLNIFVALCHPTAQRRDSEGKVRPSSTTQPKDLSQQLLALANICRINAVLHIRNHADLRMWNLATRNRTMSLEELTGKVRLTQEQRIPLPLELYPTELQPLGTVDPLHL